MFIGCSLSCLTSVFRCLAIVSVFTTILFVFCCVNLQRAQLKITRGFSPGEFSYADYNLPVSELPDPQGEQSNPYDRRTIRMVVMGFEFYWARESLKDERDVFCSEVNVTVKLKFSSDHRAIYHSDIIFFSHLFRLGKMRTWKDHLDRRRPNQRWALFSLEPPIRSARNTTVHWGWRYRTYHWTATYNQESDVPFPYGKFVPDDAHRNISNSIFKTKTKLAVFLSSNCDMTKWPRLRFVQTLQKYMPIDIYGKCGTIKCDWDKGCADELRQYKFFFALENSECDGYISEKFWNALSRYENVPIVWGARPQDYELIGPNKSYIHVSHYKSVKSLARYILSVSRNQAQYDAYHRWRQTGHIELLPDWSKLPADNHVCAAAKKYQEDMIRLGNKERTKFRDVNGKDWLESCKIGRDQVERRLPIPETQAGYVKLLTKNNKQG